MAATIEYGTTKYPVFGIQATIALSAGGGNLNWLFQSASVATASVEAVVKDGIGETKARIYSDNSGNKTLTAEVIITGADASGAATGNALPTPGTKYTITSATEPAIDGAWTLAEATSTLNNAGVQSWSMRFNRTVS